MKKQPARVNYFFGPVFEDIGYVIKSVFSKWGKSIKSSASGVGENFLEIVDAISDMSFFAAIGWTVKFGIYLSYFICNLIFTPIVSAVITVVFLIIMGLVMLVYYLAFLLMSFFDWIYRRIKKLSNGCPSCQSKFDLPVYICACGRQHDRLLPSKYGVLKRTCTCGRKLPTTFFNGRQKIDCICPNCGQPLSGGAHTEIWIPIIGGPSAGKTCLINMAIMDIEENIAPAYNLSFEYDATGEDLYEQSKNLLKQGLTPMKTSDDVLMFYQFHLDPAGGKTGNFVSLCDVAGEVFEDIDQMGRQAGYGQANAYIIVLDPLTISDYQYEVKRDGEVEIDDYRVSDKPLDEVASALITTLDNMLNTANDKIRPMVAVVFTKCDVPGLDEIIGEKAISQYMADNRAGRLQAMNALCEKFLSDYGENNFVMNIKNKFSTVQYFSCSALGHPENGTTFQPENVSDPILWILDKTCPSLNFTKEFKG